jgi:hypothetical protein
VVERGRWRGEGGGEGLVAVSSPPVSVGSS